MNRITEVTRRDVLDIIKDGFVVSLDEPAKDYETGQYITEYDVKIPFYGRLNEIDFLLRLYDLDNMPSTDSRFKNASGDIWQHTVNNDDWEPYWYLSDSRFKLSNSNDDEYLLKFISEMLHPAVRIENSQWKEYLQKFNQLLSPDGYELFATKHISGRDVFAAKEIHHIEIEHIPGKFYASLKLIGEGSYAQVFKFKDTFYNTSYALKRAKNNLDNKELERFKREFEQMKSMNSPYIVEVYSFIEEANEYIMEFLDCTLERYIKDNNSTITLKERKGIILQLIRGYQYLHYKSLFHRDVSFKNILVKKYENINVFKISDFGLVKVPDSDLTSENSELKGCLNDPTLKTKGFGNYDLLDEIYALTSLFVYILTGKTNFGNIKETHIRSFMDNGTNADRSKRFQDLDELKLGVLKCVSSMK